MSLIRPVIVQNPSASNRARSPVCIQPPRTLSRVASSSFQYPFMVEYPRVQSSPCSPTGTSVPESSTIRASRCGWIRPTVVQRFSTGSSTKALKRHRGSFGHAVADRQFSHAHLVHDPIHDHSGAWRTRHDSGSERAEVHIEIAQLFEHGHEHRWYAIERCTAFVCHSRQRGPRLKAFAGKHHHCPSADRTENPHDHAKAMVQRNGDTKPILPCEENAVGNESRIVDDVPMRKRRPFRHSGGAGCELDVDRVVRLQGGVDGRKTQLLGGSTQLLYSREAVDAGTGVRTHRNDRPQLRKSFRPQSTRTTAVEFRRQLPKHAHVLGRLEVFCGDERPATGVVEGEFNLYQLVCRVYGHQYEADTGGGKLGQKPFVPVGRPNADPVALCESDGEETCRQRIGLSVEFAVGAPDCLVRTRDCVASTAAGGRPPQQLRNCDLLERRKIGAVEIGGPCTGHTSGRRRIAAAEVGDSLSQALGQNRHRRTSTACASRWPARTRAQRDRWSTRCRVPQPASCRLVALRSYRTERSSRAARR